MLAVHFELGLAEFGSPLDRALKGFEGEYQSSDFRDADSDSRILRSSSPGPLEFPQKLTATDESCIAQNNLVGLRRHGVPLRGKARAEMEDSAGQQNLASSLDRHFGRLSRFIFKLLKRGRSKDSIPHLGRGDCLVACGFLVFA